ncbi:unnamed protein product, partial [Phaeothamnion confervicola]
VADLRRSCSGGTLTAGDDGFIGGGGGGSGCYNGRGAASYGSRNGAIGGNAMHSSPAAAALAGSRDQPMTRICELEAAVGRHAAALAERDAAAAAARADFDNDRRRWARCEAELQQRVDKLEALRDTAREVALESEATLDQTVAQLRAHAVAADQSLRPTTTVALRLGGGGGIGGGGGDETEEETFLDGAGKVDKESAYLRAQAWWLHVFNVERAAASAANDDGGGDGGAGAGAGNGLRPPAGGRTTTTTAAAEIAHLQQALREQGTELVLLRQRALEA